MIVNIRNLLGNLKIGVRLFYCNESYVQRFNLDVGRLYCNSDLNSELYPGYCFVLDYFPSVEKIYNNNFGNQGVLNKTRGNK